MALRAASLTDGDVDPTVGAAMSALGYDRDFALVPPTGPALAAVWRRVDGGGQVSAAVVPGWRSVALDIAAGQLTILPGTQLDLGATVKGWAADRSASRIATQLGCGVLVSLGGDTSTAGQPPDGGWRIRVQDVTVTISGGGLAISSAVARRWRRGGIMFHHILDPRTALPAAPVWREVSVVAANCADANTAATAAVIRGQQAAAWLASLSLPARLVEADGSVHTVAGGPADELRGLDEADPDGLVEVESFAGVRGDDGVVGDVGVVAGGDVAVGVRGTGGCAG